MRKTGKGNIRHLPGWRQCRRVRVCPCTADIKAEMLCLYSADRSWRQGKQAGEKEEEGYGIKSIRTDGVLRD